MGEDIAIIGMACLFPDAPDLETYWRNILRKVDSITDPPSDIWNADVFYDPSSNTNDRVYCKRGGFIGPLASFDPLAHGVMPRAVEGGEPDQWLALQIARAALLDAGYREEIPERHRAAVILGKGTYLNRGNLIVLQHGAIVDQTLDILRALHPEYTTADLERIRQELKRGLPPFNADTAPGLIPNIIAGRIANRLDLMGPSYTVDGACASSLLAVDQAVRSLRNREYDLALVGGVHVATPAPVLMLFCQLGALSRREQIRPFDKDADGTILGGGLGIVVLKRREDAERDGNRIYALIKGVGVSSDGRGVSVMAPRLEGEVLALEQAYRSTGVSPRTIGLIEAHGTGTPVGDATEVEALTRVFGQREKGPPWCGLGSVKSMIGHAMPAAGIAGLIKAALALYHKVLPPTLNVDEPHPALELEKTPFYINTETRPWIHGTLNTPRRAGVNAFGFGGINAHVILEEYPVTDDPSVQAHQLPWETEVCILSAGSRSELVQRVRQLQQFLKTGPQVHLKDLAYTLNLSLAQGPSRLAIIASTVEELQQKLDRALKRLSDPRCHQIKEVQGVYFFEHPLKASGQLAFLFPGEGSQYVNMLADLCIHFPEVRKAFDLMDRLFAKHARNYVPSDFIFPRAAFSPAERAAAERRLWQMEGALEAVLTASWALLTLLSRLEIHPDAVAGHSTGEYAAMIASGMIDLAGEARIAHFATELNQFYYQQLAVGSQPARAALVAVGADLETLAALSERINGNIHVAMDNCPHQTVVVGGEDEVAQFVEQLRRRGLIYERLPFDRPYHTPLFEAYSEGLREFLSRWLVHPPRIPTYSCTTMSRFPNELDEIRELAVKHWMRPVEFRKTIEAMYADGARIFVEVGPRGSLSAFVDDILRGRPHLAVAASLMSRSGITQLNHLVGLLAAHGVPMRLDYLYAPRSPRKLALDPPADAESSHRKTNRPMKLAIGWIPMGLSEETAARLRSRTPARFAPSAAPDNRGQSRAAPLASPASDRAPSAVPTDRERVPRGTSSKVAAPPAMASAIKNAAEAESRPSVSAHGASARPPFADQLMSSYWQTMEQFLAVQQEVMQTFLRGRTAVPAPGVSSGRSDASQGRWGASFLSADLPPPKAPEVHQASAPPGAVTEGLTQPTSPGQPLTEDKGAGQREPAKVNPPTGTQDISSLLLQIVSERTGYPAEMLDLDLDLEADLGIDPIKRVEIMGTFQQQTGLLQEEDMEQIAGRRSLREVMDFLATRLERRENSPAGLTALESAASSPQPLPAMPFLGTLVSLIPGQELVALREISLREDLFLRDHVLGRQVSRTDPELIGLPVMPLTMSMEMLAEAGAVLLPGLRLVGMQQVRAHRWITLEGDRLMLKVVARVNPAGPGRQVFVQIFGGEANVGFQEPSVAPIIEGTMIFDEAYPEPPPPSELPLQGERPSKWTPERLYEGVMFHGPAFRGVVSMNRWGEDGAEATLQVLPASGLFRSQPNPSFITDPILLDQPGQVVGFWMAEHLEAGYVVFPFHLEALHLYGPKSSAPERPQCRARIALVGEHQVKSDLDIVRPDGRLGARFVGWRDRRFDLPGRFLRFLHAPGEVILSESWPIAVASLKGSNGFQAYRLCLDTFPDGFFSAHGGIWQRALACLVLSRRERELWRSLRTPEPRRLQWLLGRVAAKDALRQYLKGRYGIALCPADIEILADEQGRPTVQGAWTGELPRIPILSLSHSQGVAVAVAGDADFAAGVGVDIEPAGRMGQGTKQVAFAPSEQALLSSMTESGEESWPLRLWCAKEAVAKALGQGLAAGPQALVVEKLDPDTGTVQVRLMGELALRFQATNGRPLVAYTARESDLIVATSLCRRETSEERRE